MEVAETSEGGFRHNDDKMVRFVQLLEDMGPDIAEISRRLGEHKETVRYWYKEKILKKGFAIRATPDISSLGLKRVTFLVEFASPYYQVANSILMAMSQLCYLTYFGKVLPGKKFVFGAVVPELYLNDYLEFISRLSDLGIFTSVSSHLFDWVRNPPMKAEYYNFDTGIWDFDWSKPRVQNLSGYEISKKVDFDCIDLLVVKELQKDANIQLTEIAKQHNLNYKTLHWHYINHVKDKIVKSYWINWLGTRYDFEADRALHRRHRYFGVSLLVKNVTTQENIDLSSKLNMLPFMFFEAGGRSYFSSLAFPVDFLNEAYAYLDEVLEPYTDRFELYCVDSTNAMTFTIPYNLYNQETQQWIFNKGELLEKFANMAMKIKEVRWDQ
jgi:hypothetical protein